MQIAVTGASGHIGSTLLRALIARGERPRAIVHDDRRALAGLDVEIVSADVRDPASVRAALAGAEIVYHLAAHIDLVGDWKRVEAVNVRGAGHVFAACRELKVRRLVHFSSIHAHSATPRDGVVDETRPLTEAAGDPAYDRSKAAAQRALLALVSEGLDAVIVNPTGVIGPGDYRPSVMGQVFLDLCRGKLPALVQGGFNWVDARDVADGAIAACERGRRGESYLLAGHWLSVAEIAQLACEVTGARPPRFNVPIAVARASVPFAAAWSRLTGRPPMYTRNSLRALTDHRHVSSAKAARELGFRCRPTRESVVDVYRWFTAQGVLPALPPGAA